jgi:hypothetical protein
MPRHALILRKLMERATLNEAVGSLWAQRLAHIALDRIPEVMARRRKMNTGSVLLQHSEHSVNGDAPLAEKVVLVALVLLWAKQTPAGPARTMSKGSLIVILCLSDTETTRRDRPETEHKASPERIQIRQFARVKVLEVEDR